MGVFSHIIESCGTNGWLTHAARACFKVSEEGKSAKSITGAFAVVVVVVCLFSQKEVDNSGRNAGEKAYLNYHCIDFKKINLSF